MQPGWLKQYFHQHVDHQHVDVSRRDFVKSGFVAGVAAGVAAGAAGSAEQAEAQTYINPLGGQWWPSSWGAQDDGHHWPPSGLMYVCASACSADPAAPAATPAATPATKPDFTKSRRETSTCS